LKNSKVSYSGARETLLTDRSTLSSVKFIIWSKSNFGYAENIKRPRGNE